MKLSRGVTEEPRVEPEGGVSSGAVAFGALPCDEPFPGVRRQSVSIAGATVTRYSFEPGASFPLHRHDQEQITVVEEGRVEMTIDDQPLALESGSWSVVAGKVPHGIVAGEEGARIVAIVVPRRENSGDISIEGDS
jgi:quercetin dioxygenase-like cupin family protein